MGNFLDKVGLQHFVEKIKGLLSGYLPLSGGTMTDSIQIAQESQDGHKAKEYTTVGRGYNYRYTESDSTGGQILNIDFTIDDAGFTMVKDEPPLGIEASSTAIFNTEKCNTKQFVLSGDDNQGLIANNSTTVVKELSDDEVLKIFSENYASPITGKHYLSGKGLATLSKAMYNRNSKIIIQTNADTVLYLEAGEVSNNIPAYTNFCINSDSWDIEDPNSIISMICRGFVDVDNLIDNLRYIQTFDARDSYLCNDSLENLFLRCTTLTNVDIADWNTDKVTSCSGMFQGCISIPHIDLSHWDTRNITDTSNMFSGCTNLQVLNLEGWNTQSVTTMTNMFETCGLITTLNLGPGFGRMKDSVGTLDLSPLERWTDSSVQSLTKLYDRKANGMGVITIKLSEATKNALGTSGIQTLTDKGYTIA